MNQKKKFMVIAGVLVVLLLGASVLYQQLGSSMKDQASVSGEGKVSSGTKNGELKKEIAPDFTVYDKDGAEVHLSDFRGKKVILNFWASWCGPCKMEMPDFDTVYGERGDEIQFLLINMTDGSRETQETASDFVEQSGYKFPVYFDKKAEAAVAYSVFAIPSTYLIDEEGVMQEQRSGVLDLETLRKWTEAD